MARIYGAHSGVPDMKQTEVPKTKICPLCKKEYPEEDNYCGDDGAALETQQASIGQSSPA